MMLYDPKWDQDVIYKGVSRREFIAWLETMPPNEQYEYLFAGICAVAQFLRFKGDSLKDQIVDFGSLLRGPNDPGYWLDRIVSQKPYTFGAALERARSPATGCSSCEV